jgi:hypothetical protein
MLSEDLLQPLWYSPPSQIHNPSLEKKQLWDILQNTHLVL